MLMKFWLHIEHIFVNVLDQNDRKRDTHFLSYDLLSSTMLQCHLQWMWCYQDCYTLSFCGQQVPCTECVFHCTCIRGETKGWPGSSWATSWEKKGQLICLLLLFNWISTLLEQCFYWISKDDRVLSTLPFNKFPGFLNDSLLILLDFHTSCNFFTRYPRANTDISPGNPNSSPPEILEINVPPSPAPCTDFKCNNPFQPELVPQPAFT